MDPLHVYITLNLAALIVVLSGLLAHARKLRLKRQRENAQVFRRLTELTNLFKYSLKHMDGNGMKFARSRVESQDGKDYPYNWFVFEYQVHVAGIGWKNTRIWLAVNDYMNVNAVKTLTDMQSAVRQASKDVARQYYRDPHGMNWQ